MDRHYLRVIRYLPAISVVSLLTAPVPFWYLDRNEIAAYFQSLALARTGVESYFYLTPIETLSGLHLYSLLSAPFIAIGYREGGRLVSLLAAFATIIFLSMLARDLYGTATAVLAPVVLWCNPIFLKHSVSFSYVMLSIALTTGAIAAIIRFRQTENGQWFLLSTVFVVAGIINHLWEAVIILPVVALLLVEQEYSRATILTSVAGVTGGVVYYLMTLQPRGPSALHHFGIQATGLSVFYSVDWWNWGFHRAFTSALTLTLWLSVIAFLSWSWRYYQIRDDRSLLFATWLLSGLSIPFLLPGGYPVHPYYNWGLVVPLAASLSRVVYWLIQQGCSISNISKPTRDGIVLSMAFLLAATAILYGYGFNTMFDHTGIDRPAKATNNATVEETVQAGQELSESGVSSYSDVVFMGDWSEPYIESNIYRVLIYSDLLVRERGLTNEGGIKINPGGEIDCSATIVRKLGENITVDDSRSC